VRTLYITFLSEQDRVQGFYELVTRARVSSLPNQVYQVPIEALKLLDDRHIACRRASDAEVKGAQDQVRRQVVS
jgi:hypothetical protein